MAIDHSDPIYILRQQLAAEITRSLGGPSAQFVVAPYYGIPQPRMSELSRGLVDRCTIEWLIRRVYRMGGSVTLHVELGDADRAWVLRRCEESTCSPTMQLSDVEVRILGCLMEKEATRRVHECG